ncbi:MAG TPA: phosphotransferase, partial [Gammaproteobacteria bacterium]|nr:phosphotransferase [Gammaproteobacteria bacterium]
LNLPFANDLHKNSIDLIALNKYFQNAIPVLKTNVVVSHVDLDQKNVLWDANGKPILIDWESARRINPTYDLISTAFDWSGIATNNFNRTLFLKMIELYEKSGGIINKNHLDAAYYGVIGNCLNWMIYNIKRARASEDLEQRSLSMDQVNQTLFKILRLKNEGIESMKIVYAIHNHS